MYFVRFTRIGTHPVEVSRDTPEEEIEAREVSEGETFRRGSGRFYDMVIGHGEVLRLRVEEDATDAAAPKVMTDFAL